MSNIISDSKLLVDLQNIIDTEKESMKTFDSSSFSSNPLLLFLAPIAKDRAMKKIDTLMRVKKRLTELLNARYELPKSQQKDTDDAKGDNM